MKILKINGMDIPDLLNKISKLETVEKVRIRLKDAGFDLEKGIATYKGINSFDYLFLQEENELQNQKIEEILKEIFDEGISKANGSNPYHWFNELKDIYVKKILSLKDIDLDVKADLRIKGRNGKHFTKWMRKGRCPGCHVGCGSDHREDCWARKELLSQI